MDWATTEREFKHYLLTSGKSQETSKTYTANLSKFWRSCAQWEITPYDADRPLIRLWLADRLKCVSSTRAHNDLAALKLFYAYLIETRYRDDNPTENIQVKRSKNLPTEPLGVADLDKLMVSCKSERDRVMFLILANTGIRISELANLKAEDVNWTRGELRITGKGDKQRDVSPPREVIDRLHAYAGMFPAGPLFLSRIGNPLSAQQIRKILYEVADRAGLEHVHPHRFRAMYATQFIEQFADIQALQGALGHESISTTSRYSEWTKRQRAQRMMQAFTLGATG